MGILSSPFTGKFRIFLLVILPFQGWGLIFVPPWVFLRVYILVHVCVCLWVHILIYILYDFFKLNIYFWVDSTLSKICGVVYTYLIEGVLVTSFPFFGISIF